MASHPAAPDTKTIGINFKLEMAELIEERAASMHLSTAKYCNIILRQWLDSGKKVTLKEK